MTVRKIVIEPDPILRRKSDYISNVDNQLRLLMDDMLDTMYKAPGIGLCQFYEQSLVKQPSEAGLNTLSLAN